MTSATADPLLAPLLAGQRRSLAKAITLLESTHPEHRVRADALLNALLPYTGGSLRLGISGVPGVGKSTFIEALGLALVAQGHRVAVLAVDPSSSLTGGSILGDKTRMNALSVEDAAFIRPSPAGGVLGGVAEKTREAMLACEAAGFDVVIVETVGVGQSEANVASMTDFFVLLQLPHAGDDLQAVKRGVLEWADMVVINKADIDPAAAALAQSHIAQALHLQRAKEGVQVVCVSALNPHDVMQCWLQVQSAVEQLRASAGFEQRRKQQALAWMWDLIRDRLMADFKQHPAVHAALRSAEQAVETGHWAPSVAARHLLGLCAQDANHLKS